MKKTLYLLGTVLCTVMVIGFCLLMWRAINPDDEISIDPEYAILTAADEVATVSYPIDACSGARFFYADHTTGSKKTIFLNACPDVRVINSNEYRVELTANQAIHDMIDIRVIEGLLHIDMRMECYNRVHEEDDSYDYDHGLYVDCTAFEMTIYAPLGSFWSDIRLKLDMGMPYVERASLIFSHEGVEANIHDIDSWALYFTASGDSEVKLSGNVAGPADIAVWHNSHVDATELKMGSQDFRVSSQPFKASYIRYSGGIKTEGAGAGTIFTALIIGFILLWAALDVACIWGLLTRKKNN